jgi:hypothetical protein
MTFLTLRVLGGLCGKKLCERFCSSELAIPNSQLAKGV